MSFILDALKKAERERHLGSVPSLHAPTLTMHDAPTSRTRGGMPRLFIGLALVILLAALLGAGAYAVWQRSLITVAIHKPEATFPPVPVQPPLAANPQAGSRPAAHRTPSPIALPSLAELPTELRQAVPALTVNGYIYADKPADRTVILNQRLLHEGAQITPELVLESIGPKEMILRIRGQRFRAPY